MHRNFSFEEDGTLNQSEGGYTDYVNRKREATEDETTDNDSNKPATAEKTDRSNWNAGRKKKLKYWRKKFHNIPEIL